VVRACWTPLACALEGEFDVVMPDARGHGGSSAPHHGYRYDDHASDVVGLIRGPSVAPRPPPGRARLLELHQGVFEESRPMVMGVSETLRQIFW
jgi:hypothetical protein